MKGHPQRAKEFLKNTERVAWHDKALWYVREKRDAAANEIADWENLRETAHAIKAHTLANLGTYLTEFEKNASAKGVIVHFAKDAQEHNEIVHGILERHNVKHLVKSKSMLTEECGLNPYLIDRGIDVVDTDLGERIVQLAEEEPSHIVLPAIHKKKEEVGELFHKYLNTEKGASDPTYLTQAARAHLREKFLAAEAGLTGVNFAVAETGGVTIVTNEGNADLGTSLPPLYIASMGIEKIVPKAHDLSVFVRLLPRAATGQPITTYTSHLLGPREGQEMHIIIVDNGRSDILKKDDFRRALYCIRCGSCLNTCPVYRRTGGHSYGYVIPGPIGCVLASLRDVKKYKTLPFASSLCGSCAAVCPVKIDLDTQLLKLRHEVVKAGKLGFIKRIALAIASFVMGSTFLFTVGGKIARTLLRILPKPLYNNALTIWGRTRDLPDMPAKSFRAQYKAYVKQQNKVKKDGK